MTVLTSTPGVHYVVINHDIESDDISGVFATFEQAAWHLANHEKWWWGCDIERWCGTDHETMLSSWEIKRPSRANWETHLANEQDKP